MTVSQCIFYITSVSYIHVCIRVCVCVSVMFPFTISFIHRPRTKDDLRAYCILLQVRKMQYFDLIMCVHNS